MMIDTIQNTISNNVLIQAKKGKKSLHQVPGTDIVLHLPTHFRENEHDVVTQDGIVIAAPQKYEYLDDNRKRKISTDIQIKKGDHVYCHHFLTHEENTVDGAGEDVYTMDYNEIYCKIEDGKIIMINDWSLLEAVKEEKSETSTGIVIGVQQKNITGLAIMRHPSKQMEADGITDGTKVEFVRNGGYEIIVEGKTYYRLKDSHILMAYGKE